MTVSYEPQRFVTPLQAIELLDNQVPNRPIAWTTVNRYAADMFEGNWFDNGETIKINPEGKMLDGQHRLQAVVVAEDLAKKNDEKFEGMYFDFAHGVTDEARKTMDIGRKRTMADEIGFRGGKDASRQAAIASWHVAYLGGNYINANGAGVHRPTQSQILRAWEENRDIYYTSSLRSVDTMRAGLGAPAPLGVAYHILRTTFGDDITEQFWTPFLTGANLPEKHPILALRNRLMSGRIGHHKIERKQVLALVFKAWNAWLDDRKIESMYFKEDVNNKTFKTPRAPGTKRGAQINKLDD